MRWREEGIAPTLNKEVGSTDSRRRPGLYSYLLQRDQAEEAAEHKRLFYVAATRAADTLYVSGDEARGGDGWLTSALGALRTGAPGGVEIRPALPVDLSAIAHQAGAPRPSRRHLSTRRRASCPPSSPGRASSRSGRARRSPPCERRRTRTRSSGMATASPSSGGISRTGQSRSGSRPRSGRRVVELARTLDDDLGERAVEQLVAEVDAMLDLLDASPLAATLRDPDTRAHFELPFSWDWDGVPVHGTIDLAYEAGGAWRVVDFKTDEVRGGLAETADPYLPQLALYASALERATGQRPEASLLFLRDCRTYTPPPMDLYGALVTTRERIDAGQMLETPQSSDLDDTPEDRIGL